MSVTKNRQSIDSIHSLTSAAFYGKQIKSVAELTEGMFNAAYRIQFTDDSQAILKISAASGEGLLSNEINLMQAEVETMKLLRQQDVPYIPKVLYSDFSRSLCSGNYFFMEVMPGCSLSSCQSQLPEETVNAVLYEAGQLQRRLTFIRNPLFGLVGDPNRFSTLFEMLEYMFTNVLADAKKKNISFPFSMDGLFHRLRRDSVCFEEVRFPSLVHWDMWEGNLFIREGRLSGVIDWERAMWGDPLMDDRFRTRNHNKAFFEGFGKKDFTLPEKRRILWYDLFLVVTMLTETHYRQYDDMNATIQWLIPQLTDAWSGLEMPIKG